MPSSQREEGWELNDSLDDFLVDIVRLVIIIKGRISSQQLIYQNSDSPIINSLSIPALVVFIEHLGRKVFWSSANCECSSVSGQLFGKTQINQFGKSLTVNHDVFGFQVSEYDRFRV